MIELLHDEYILINGITQISNFFILSNISRQYETPLKLTSWNIFSNTQNNGLVMALYYVLLNSVFGFGAI